MARHLPTSASLLTTPNYQPSSLRKIRPHHGNRLEPLKHKPLLPCPQVTPRHHLSWAPLTQTWPLQSREMGKEVDSDPIRQAAPQPSPLGTTGPPLHTSNLVVPPQVPCSLPSCRQLAEPGWVLQAQTPGSSSPRSRAWPVCGTLCYWPRCAWSPKPGGQACPQAPYGTGADFMRL